MDFFKYNIVYDKIIVKKFGQFEIISYICIKLNIRQFKKMDKDKVIDYLSRELVKRDRESLCRELSTMTFQQAYEKLGGYNLSEDCFDVNYKSITATIYCTCRGNCVLHGSIELWIDGETSPITMHEEDVA